MSALLRPICWLERHHWLLQNEEPKTLYADNGKVRDYRAWYECQRCGKWSYADAVNLDNLPELEQLTGKTPPTNKESKT